jgi:hypothetical protein
MTVTELKEAIEHLNFEERAQLEALLHPFDPDEWDKQPANDFAAEGRLSWLVKEVDNDIRDLKLKNMP